LPDTRSEARSKLARSLDGILAALIPCPFDDRLRHKACLRAVRRLMKLMDQCPPPE